MSSSDISRPLLESLDWHASVAAGWDPDSGEDPTYSFGELSLDIEHYKDFFDGIMKSVALSDKAFLLDPIGDVAEPEFFPEIQDLVDEELVVIDPSFQEKTGLYPKAALWQSGWANALPYVVVRKSLQLRLQNVVDTLRTFNSELSLCITDGWRSLDQQKDLYDAFYPNGHIKGEPLYVSVPHLSDAHAAPHPSGGAVDVLPGIGSQAVRIGSELDFMDVQANSDYYEQEIFNGSLVQNMRRLFINTMTDAGFTCIDSEWWHFEYGTRRWSGKTGNRALYGNAYVREELLQNIEPVAPIAGSKRFALSHES